MRREELMGARGEVGSLEELLALLGALPGEVIALRASEVMGREHLRSALMHAARAFERGENSARSLGMETLLYLSGERQISRALARLGLRPGDREFALIALGSDGAAAIRELGWERDDSLLDLSAGKEAMMRRDEPIASLPALGLALERVAMLDIIK